jgi:sugar O-acyltransferase (sialic acid O-acetyltransferase NeuD family)
VTEPIRIVVVGAGGHGREVCDVVELLAAEGTHQLVGVVDDDPGPHHLLLQRGIPHLGPVDVIAELPGPIGWALGVGDPAARRALDERVRALGLEAASLVHPAASVGSAGSHAPGLLLAAGARLTSNVTTGRHVHLNVNATASHDCVLGDHVILNPGAHVTGGVTLGDGVMVGAGAVVRQGTTVGAGAVIGAGAVVVDDVAPGATVVGVPARPLPT